MYVALTSSGQDCNRADNDEINKKSRWFDKRERNE